MQQKRKRTTNTHQKENKIHPSIHMSSVVTKATTDLATYEQSACAMQRTWQDALVLAAGVESLESPQTLHCQ